MILNMYYNIYINDKEVIKMFNFYIKIAGLFLKLHYYFLEVAYSFNYSKIRKYNKIFNQKKLDKLN